MTQPVSLRLTLLLGALAAFAPMSIDMYLPSLPTLARDFATDAATVQRTLAAFMIGLALGQLAYGPLSDRIGRKPPMLAGIAVYVVTSIGCMLAPGIDGLIGLRFLQALGACGGIVIGRAIVRDLYGPQDAARVFSMLMLVMGVAPILAPWLGAQVMGPFGWQGIFAVLALFGLLCLVAVWRLMPETRPRTHVHHGGVLRGYGALLSDQRFMRSALVCAFGSISLFTYIAESAPLMIDGYGVSPQDYGLLFGLNAAAVIGASQVNRLLLRRWPPARVIAWTVPAAAIVNLGVLAVAASGLGGLAGLVVAVFFSLACFGLTVPNAVATALGAIPAERAGAASALVGALQFTGGAAAASLVGLLHDGSALPLGAMMAGAALLALAAQRLLKAT
ncbi:multidrug effflux MFS transporter [Desertibaculum subflavum]|uniref:multidrug effflux MFS transporter n=1 Tax=Desertibaculum subflavum TaxID=2268458 RepID=UPI000E671C1D